MAEKRDIVIIGGGPGGYLAAMRAAQLRKTVTVVEQDRIGGTCINYGCIPTKYLLHQTKVLKEIDGAKTLEGPVGEIRLNWAKVQQGRQAVVDQLVKGLVFLLEKGKVEIVKAPARLRADRSVVVDDGGRGEGHRGRTRSSWPRAAARPACRSSRPTGGR